VTPNSDSTSYRTSKTQAASPIELPMQFRYQRWYFTSAQRPNGPRRRFPVEKEAMPITRPRTRDLRLRYRGCGEAHAWAVVAMARLSGPCARSRLHNHNHTHDRERPHPGRPALANLPTRSSCARVRYRGIPYTYSRKRVGLLGSALSFFVAGPGMSASSRL